MRDSNLRMIGSVLIGLAIILIFILSFVKLDIDKEQAFLCNTVHSDPELSQSCPVHESNVSWLMTISFVLAAIVLISGVYLLFMPALHSRKDKESIEVSKENINKDIKSERLDFKEVDVSKLDEDEKIIYDLLKRNNGSMYQSDIIKETQYSKVKTTRLLDKLHSRGIVDRQRRGMTNIVVLK